MNFSEKDPLLNFYENFVVYWVQIWVLSHRLDEMNVALSHFRSLKWKALT